MILNIFFISTTFSKFQFWSEFCWCTWHLHSWIWYSSLYTLYVLTKIPSTIIPHPVEWLDPTIIWYNRTHSLKYQKVCHGLQRYRDKKIRTNFIFYSFKESLILNISFIKLFNAFQRVSLILKTNFNYFSVLNINKNCGILPPVTPQTM